MITDEHKHAVDQLWRMIFGAALLAALAAGGIALADEIEPRETLCARQCDALCTWDEEPNINCWVGCFNRCMDYEGPCQSSGCPTTP